MFRIHLVFVLSILFVSVTCHAASVEWNIIDLYEGGAYTSPPQSDGSYLVETYYFVHGPAPMWLDVMNWYQQNGEPYGNGGSGLVPGWTQGQAVDFTAAWVEAQVGDVVNREYIENARPYFFRTIIYGYDGFDTGGVDVNAGEIHYLAWAGATESNPYNATFGWMSFTIDDAGNLQVLSSAWDRDGDPIIVGMGPTPEPASGLLLLVGGALLALRMRRRAPMP